MKFFIGVSLFFEEKTFLQRKSYRYGDMLILKRRKRAGIERALYRPFPVNKKDVYGVTGLSKGGRYGTKKRRIKTIKITGRFR